MQLNRTTSSAPSLKLVKSYYLLSAQRVWDLPKAKNAVKRRCLLRKCHGHFLEHSIQKKHRHWICKSSVGALSAFGESLWNRAIVSKLMQKPGNCIRSAILQISCFLIIFYFDFYASSIHQLNSIV